MPRTSIIIPVHNRREITRRCLAHLQAQDIPSWAEVIVVDDGSTDGTGAMIAAEFPWAQVIWGDGDLWWAGGIDRGMRHAITHGADCIIWLNDDTLPDPGTLSLLAATAVDQICGALCRGTDGRPLAYGGGFIVNGWPVPVESAPAAELRVQFLHGNLVAVPASAWRRIGLPECRWMRHNLADIDYTHRAHEAGIPVLLLPQATAAALGNDSLSYRSWADPHTSPWELLAGFWNPRVWWYLPGLFCFLVRNSGHRALVLLPKMLVKAVVISALKCLLPAAWVLRIRTCKDPASATRTGALNNPVQ